MPPLDLTPTSSLEFCFSMFCAMDDFENFVRFIPGWLGCGQGEVDEGL